jgi:hypothetical protein
MKIISLTLSLFFLVAFTSIPVSKDVVLYKTEKGTLSINKDFIKVNFDIIIEKAKAILLKFWF